MEKQEIKKLIGFVRKAKFELTLKEFVELYNCLDLLAVFASKGDESNGKDAKTGSEMGSGPVEPRPSSDRSDVKDSRKKRS